MKMYPLYQVVITELQEVELRVYAAFDDFKREKEKIAVWLIYPKIDGVDRHHMINRSLIGDKLFNSIEDAFRFKYKETQAKVNFLHDLLYYFGNASEGLTKKMKSIIQNCMNCGALLKEESEIKTILCDDCKVLRRNKNEKSN